VNSLGPNRELPRTVTLVFSTPYYYLPKAFGLLKTTELLRRLWTTQVDQQACSFGMYGLSFPRKTLGELAYDIEPTHLPPSFLSFWCTLLEIRNHVSMQ
jgi:hypothetical protein